MGLREDLMRRIERKQAELSLSELEWERRKAGAEAYIQALQETIKALPRDASDVKPEHILRAGGALARVRELILVKRRPQHVDEILQALAKPIDKKSRASITSAIGMYVRRGEIFVRTAPNTFGLIELDHAPDREENVPPPGFGRTVQAASSPEPEVTLEDDDEVPF
jgi:hypothetical protein